MRRTDAITRFWSHVDRNGPTLRADLGPCWVWTASKTHDGYGRFTFDGKCRIAHRWLFQRTHDVVPDAMVLHRCDNRACVRPDHLYEGDHAQNMRDMVSRERQAAGRRSGRYTRPDRNAVGDRNGTRRHPETRPRGEANHAAKLTADGVREMRRLRLEEGLSLNALARKFGIAKQSVSSVLLGRSWGHVQ